MKVLIVSSGNSGNLAPFVREQVNSLKAFNIEFDYYNIIGKGVSGYLSNIINLRKKIISCNPDLIHAHYGLSGFLTLFVRKGYLLVTTFHGNDINPVYSHDVSKPSLNRIISKITHIRSNYSIFVNRNLAASMSARQDKSAIIPCQVDLRMFYPVNKSEARKQVNFSPDKRYVLFSSSFSNAVKNYPLAKAACQTFNNLELIELRGYTRQEVNLLLNACDLALITSLNEGSSQFLKEAMATNCPIVSTRVGDAELVLDDLDGCYLTGFQIYDIILNINKALSFSQGKGRTLGRQRIIDLEMDSEHIGKKIYNVYLKTVKGCVEFAE